MNDLDQLETIVRARGDQVAAHMRDLAPDIKRIANTEPTLWTPRDHEMIRFVLEGAYGFVLEGRI